MIIKLRRYAGNPVLQANPAHAWEAQNVSNAGAALHEGKVHLLYRAESFEPREPTWHKWPRAVLGHAVSDDGFHFRVDERPALEHDPEEFGADALEDARISKIGDTYYIVYTTTSAFFGDHLALATTGDFKTYERRGPLMPHISQRASVLFPGRIGGRYALLHRIMPSMWLSFSDDLEHWDPPLCLLSPKAGTWYNLKLGPGAQPIEMENAWLIFWHAKSYGESIPYGLYRLGVLWLDKEDPSRILKFQEEPILEIEEDYEREGHCPNVVYTCGAVEKDGQYLVYYGCADRCLAVASVPVDDVEKALRDGMLSKDI